MPGSCCGRIGIIIRYRTLRILAIAVIVGAFGVSLSDASQAQGNSSQPDEIIVAPLNKTDAPKYELELKSLEFDRVIAETSMALAAPATRQDEWLLRYFRGTAYWYLGFLDDAESDMVAIGGDDVVPDPQYPTPRAFIQTIARQKALRPAHRHEVVIGNVPMFTVFADDEDDALREIIDLLPVAVNSVKSLTRLTPHKTVILVFRDLSRMHAYDDVPLKLGAMGCWAWAHASASGVRICPAGAEATPAPDIRGYYFRSTIAHEYMHTAVARILGGETQMPIWLNEGVADVAGALAAPAAEARHAWRFSQVLLHHAILPLSTMCGAGYYEETQNQYAKGGLHDPYAQGHSMTTYLMLGRPPEILLTLFRNMKDTREFPKAFAATFGESVDEFYARWRNYVGE